MNSLTHSFSTNIYVTLLVAALVVILPLLDISICRRLGVDVRHGISDNPNSKKLLVLRRGILWIVFGLYMAANAYLVFFSRDASMDYKIHTRPLDSLFPTIDTGIFGLFHDVVTGKTASGLTQSHITSLQDLTQIYLNMMLYIPLGYLLPYIFRWFRQRPRIRPVAAGFVVSFLTENLQLVFKRGFYDVDDLITNVLGAFLGTLLFRSFAFVVVRPNWREERKALKQWRKNAWRRSLYPFMRRMNYARTTLYTADERTVWDFYVKRLGFRVLNRLERGDDIRFLLGMGEVYLEVICVPAEQLPREQHLSLQILLVEKVRIRLEKDGFRVSPFMWDEYTRRRKMIVEGPDNVQISIME